MSKNFNCFHICHINIQSAYFRILVSTLAVTLIPLFLICALISSQTVKTLEQQSEIIDSAFVARTQESVEQTLFIVQQDAATLADSRDTLSFVFLPTFTDHMLLQRVGQDLHNICASNPLISSAYVYSAYQQKVMTSDFRYYSIDGFYDSDWLTPYHQESAPVFWLQPRTVLDGDGNRSSCISLIVHVPSSSRKLSGAIVFNVKTSDIDTTFLSGTQGSAGNMNILDKDFYPLIKKQETVRFLHNIDTSWFTNQTSGSRSLFIGNERHLLTYSYSPMLGWYFIRTSPLGSAWDSFNELWATVILFAIILLFACVMAVHTSRKLYRPIKQLAENVTGQKAQESKFTDEYNTIQEEYSHMQTKAQVLESEIAALQPLIRERYCLRLLRGQVPAAEQNLTQFGSISHLFAVFIVRCVDSRQSAVTNSDLRYFQVRSQIEEILRSNTQFHFMCVETSDDTITTLINFKETFTAADARRTLLGLSKFTREALAENQHVDTVTGFSPLCHSASEIPTSYTAALKSIRFKLFQESDDVVREDDELFAPYSALLQELMEQITSGNGNYVRAALDELFHTIRSHLESLSQFQIQQIATHILNQLMELLIQNKLKPEHVFGEKRSLFTELRQYDDLDNIHKWMEAACLQATKELALATERQANQKIVRIQEYIEQHISEDISLNDVSEWVGLSPAYVSRTFKESTGQNFVEYLSICRVEQAKQLLHNTQMSIKEIGFHSGFNSMQTFIRTFKKLEKCTPSQYRDKKFL